jgi:hypothetical protein
MVGASIGRFISNPLLALLAGILSHLIVDKVPHFWPESKKAQHRMIIVDGILSFIVLCTVILVPGPNKASVAFAALGGASVDLIFVILPMFWKKFYNNPIRVWHEKRQYHFHNPIWIATDVFMTVVALGVLYAW